MAWSVEYQNTGTDVHKNYDKAGPWVCCVRCEQKKATRVSYVQWGRKTCSNGHKLEYYGLIMMTDR